MWSGDRHRHDRPHSRAGGRRAHAGRAGLGPRSGVPRAQSWISGSDHDPWRADIRVPIGTRPIPQLFLVRNRVISGRALNDIVYGANATGR